MSSHNRIGPWSGEVVPGVHRIDAEFGERFASLYLFVGTRRSVLYDVGLSGAIPEYLVPYAERHALDLSMVERVVVSHFDVDHFGGLGDVRSSLVNAQTVAHELDAEAMVDFDVFLRERGSEFSTKYGLPADPISVEWMRSAITPGGRIDTTVKNGFEIDLGDRAIRVLHAPGHSRGHLIIHDVRRNLLAISDAILGDAVPAADGSPAFPPTYRHESAYRSTIDRVAGMSPGLLATAHFGVLRGGEIESFLRASRAFGESLRTLVCEYLMAQDRGTSLSEMLVELNLRVGAWPKEGAEYALAFPVVAHLEQLAEESLVTIDIHSKGALIQWASES